MKLDSEDFLLKPESEEEFERRIEERRAIREEWERRKLDPSFSSFHTEREKAIQLSKSRAKVLFVQPGYKAGHAWWASLLCSLPWAPYELHRSADLPEPVPEGLTNLTAWMSRRWCDRYPESAGGAVPFHRSLAAAPPQCSQRQQSDCFPAWRLHWAYHNDSFHLHPQHDADHPPAFVDRNPTFGAGFSFNLTRKALSLRHIRRRLGAKDIRIEQKAILQVRDPRDIVVSAYHYEKKCAEPPHRSTQAWKNRKQTLAYRLRALRCRSLSIRVVSDEFESWCDAVKKLKKDDGLLVSMLMAGFENYVTMISTFLRRDEEGNLAWMPDGYWFMDDDAPDVHLGSCEWNPPAVSFNNNDDEEKVEEKSCSNDDDDEEQQHDDDRFHNALFVQQSKYEMNLELNDYKRMNDWKQWKQDLADSRVPMFRLYRYEDLFAFPEDSFRAIGRWFFPESPHRVRAFVRLFAAQNERLWREKQQRTTETGEVHFRSGKTEQWRDELKPVHLRCIDHFSLLLGPRRLDVEFIEDELFDHDVTNMRELMQFMKYPPSFPNETQHQSFDKIKAYSLPWIFPEREMTCRVTSRLPAQRFAAAPRVFGVGQIKGVHDSASNWTCETITPGAHPQLECGVNRYRACLHGVHATLTRGRLSHVTRDYTVQLAKLLYSTRNDDCWLKEAQNQPPNQPLSSKNRKKKARKK